MYQLGEEQYTLKELQGFAKKQDLDFNTFMSDMKGKGLAKAPDPEDVKREKAFKNVVSPNVLGQDLIPGFKAKAFVGIDNTFKMVKDAFTDKEEIKETVEVLINETKNIPTRFKSFLVNKIPAFGGEFFKRMQTDVDYDPEELNYLKTLDPTASYESPTADPTGFKTNADRIKFLENYDSSGVAQSKQQTNEFLKRQYKEMKAVDKYLIKDTGEGIVKGFKQGDLSDFVGGIFRANTAMIETALPALATGGVSLPFQIIAPMFTDYNEAKARTLYGDNDEAMDKLIDNDEVDLALPTALGVFATGLEYIGLKGVTKYIFSNAGKSTLAAKLLLSSNREGLTEWGQSGIEAMSRAYAEQKSTGEAIAAMWDTMTSEEGLESYLMGFVGSAGVGAGSKFIGRALRSDNASVKELNKKINDYATLNNLKYNYKNKPQEYKDQVDAKLEQSKEDLKKYINEKRKIKEILTDEQKTSLENILQEKDNIKDKIQKIQDQYQNGDLTKQERGFALKSLTDKDKVLSERIELINETAKEQLLTTRLEGTKEAAEEIGIEQKEVSKEEFGKIFPGEEESDGAISEDGKTYYINTEVARETGAIGVGSHELLHGIIGNSYNKLDKEAKIKLNKDLLDVLDEDGKQRVLKRLKLSYQIDGDAVFETEELFTSLSDEIQDGYKFNEGVFGKIKNVLEDVLRKLSEAGYFVEGDFLYRKEFGNARQAFNFIKDYSTNIKKNKISDRAKTFATEDPGGGERLSKTLSKKTPEELVKIIQRGQNPQRVKEANEALAPQFELLALSKEALNYDTRTGDIAREDVVAEAMTYLPGIIKRYNKKDGAFSTFVIANMKPKRQVIYEKVKPLTYGKTTSIDTKEAKQIEGDVGTTTNLEDTFVQKINILQDFAIANRVADKIKSLVKVVKGDNFKSIISKYAGKVGELIFEVPAKKIMEGGANLAAVTKYTEGMPVPAEAQNIQRFFNAPNNADKFIKTLPLYNVTDKTADINKIGENLDVSRDTYGYAIGLKGLPLDYFYENYTDPTGEITSPKGRSKGLTSQTQVKKLKPQFVNPTPEIVEQFKKDLGITPKNEASVYSRDIGQLLKGVAKVHSINAAISGAQRFLEAKTKVAPAQEQKALKQQTADITAAQGKAAFSKTVEDIISVRDQFEMEEGKVIDKLFKFHGIEATYDLKTEEGIKQLVEVIEKDLLPLMPKDFWFGKGGGTVFTPSYYVVGKSDNKFLKEKYKNLYNNLYVPAIKKLRDKEGVVFGKPIKDANGNDIDFSISSYSTIFKNQKTIQKNIDNGEIEKWNKKVALIHKEMWKRFDKAINKNGKIDKNAARVIGNYLKITGNDTKHWHKMGAQFVGYSKKLTPTKSGSLKVEYEHAMPATAAYLYLIDSSLSKSSSFKASYDLVIDNYKLIYLDKAMDEKLIAAGLRTKMPKDWSVISNSWWERYFNEEVASIDPSSIIGLDGRTFKEIFNTNKNGKALPIKENISKTKKINKAIRASRTVSEPKGITVLDFDDTLATTKSLVKYTTPEGTTGTLNAEEYAKTYEDLLDLGYVFDFSDFNKVVKGKLAPLFNKAIKLQGKFGPENMFVLTARPPQAQKAIFDFLKANGLNIPLKNITGLGNSTAEAKALWVADKVGEGFNDFYFADDALQNVQAVKNMLDQFDVKSKVQQAKVKFSKTMSDDFNNILEEVTGIESFKRFERTKARKRGADKGKFRLFIPPSHEDFVGLLYNFMGKGKKGDAHRNFFEQALVRPLNRAYKEVDTAKQAVANDYKALNKQMPEVNKMLSKKTPDGDFTYQDAIRVYLWDKHGYKIPGLSEVDQAKLVELVKSDGNLQSYANTLNIISKQETYVDPGPSWESGNIRIDLVDATGRVGRASYFAEFQENADIMFSEENLNKIEAAYGPAFREALEDMLHRIKTGVNRPKGSSSKPNMFMNWLNASVAGVMFLNVRSSLLQQMSNVNYLNFADNNILAAGKAFANQPQYWKDFAMIFNSDMLKQRRGGLQTDINGAELAEAIKKARPGNLFDQVAIITGKALRLGFLPTQIGDNIAIATGGAAFYRNRVNKYIKDGLSKKEAETKAFTDFQDITQSTQQSARPDMTSKQQASWIGKLVLNFLNTPSQYNRIIKKAGSDILNGRITPPNTSLMQSNMSNMSRILYYGAAQNLIFYSLQTALFAVMFGSDDEDEDKRVEAYLTKKQRVIQGSIDTILRGSGIYGVAVSTLKNMAIKFMEQREAGYNKDESAVIMEMLNFSPVVGIKARRIVNAEKTLNYNKKVIEEMETFDIDNPMWSAVTNYTQTITTAPTNKIYQKTINLRNAADNDYTALQRLMFLSGYTTWSLNLGDTKKMKDIKEKIKSDKKKAKAKAKSKTKKVKTKKPKFNLKGIWKN